MAKAPAMQFYVRDWLTDEHLSQCSMSVQGLWMRMLCHMWLSDSKGVLTGTVTELHSRCNVHGNSIVNFLQSASKHPFCDIDYDEATGVYTITNRRMKAEFDKIQGHRARQQRYRDRQKGGPSDASVTPPSATASATASANAHNSASRDAASEELPAGPAGWIVTACTLTGRLLREEDRASAHKCAKVLHGLHGDTSNEMLSRICTGPPVVRFPRWLLERAVDKGASGGVAETVDEKAARLMGQSHD